MTLEGAHGRIGVRDGSVIAVQEYIDVRGKVKTKVLIYGMRKMLEVKDNYEQVMAQLGWSAERVVVPIPASFTGPGVLGRVETLSAGNTGSVTSA